MPLLIVVALLVAHTATAQTIAITGGQVLPVSGPAIEKGTVIIQDGKITAVGANVTVPPGAQVIDATGKIVTPGLLDSATQIGIVEIGFSADGTADEATTDSRLSASFDVTDAFNGNSTLIPITRVEGITRAVVTPTGTGEVIIGQGAVVDLGGSQVPASITRRHAAMYALLGESGAAVAGGSRATAMLRLKEALQDAQDFAVNRVSFNTGQRRTYSRSRLDLEALLPVLRGEVPLAITANRASDLLAAIRLGEQFKIRIVLLGAAEGWMVADELAKRRIPVVVKPLYDSPAFDTLGATLENAGRLARAGVTVALATFEAHNSRLLRQEAGNAIANGMDRTAALEAVTLAPARMWGVADRYGSLEVGKEADVVVWSGDPFELTTGPEHVFIRGQEVPKDTRQLRLMERYKDLKTMPRR